MLLEAFLALTGRADLDLKPVIDLNHGRSVNQYEHPAGRQGARPPADHR